MPDKIGILLTILAASVMLAACSLFQQKPEQKTETETETAESNEASRLLPGTWKIIAVNCDRTGINCQQYPASRIFQFSPDGVLTVNGMKRGTYRLEDRNCLLDTGNKQYTVSIIQIGASRMVTGEPHRDTTEVLNRIR